MNVEPTPRVLIVDDEKQFAANIKEHLENAGWSAEVVGSGEDALKVLFDPERRFDAVLLDRRMPGVWGDEVLRRLKQSLDHQFLCVVILSALDQSEQSAELLNVGAFHYLDKIQSMDTIKRVLVAGIAKSKLGMFRDNLPTYGTIDELFSEIQLYISALLRPARLLSLIYLDKDGTPHRILGPNPPPDHRRRKFLDIVCKNRRSLLENNPALVPDLNPFDSKAISLLAVPIRARDNSVAGALAMESADHQIELFWHGVMCELAHIVYVYTQQNAVATMEIERRSTDDVALVASEFRHKMGTTLTNIGFHLNLLKSKLNETLPESPAADSLRRHIASIEEESKGIARTLQHLRESSKDLPIVLSVPEPVLPWLTRAADVYLDKCRASTVDFIFRSPDPTDPEPLICYDPEWLRYALDCLVNNALESIGDYSKNAYPLRKTRHEIKLEVLVDAGWLEIVVSDSGQGFDQSDMHDRLFLPLYTTKGSGERSDHGIGLFTARRIVTKHNGSLTGTSPGLGKGATFTIKLPLVPGGPVQCASQ